MTAPDHLMPLTHNRRDEGGVGARPADQALVSDQAGKGRLDPPGFDPSRFVGCCYRCTKEECARSPRLGLDWRMQRMFLCAICGNKRCPHATDHRHACTGSNTPGQPGSNYADTDEIDGLALLGLLSKFADEAGSLSAWAKSRGIHPEIALQVARGERTPAPKLLRAMGLRRIVTYGPAKHGDA